MPSWNIHIAHVERLLAEESPERLGIRDVNCFLVGNVLPDIYVGYMVPDVTHKIEYRQTHLADPSHVPEPRYGEFFERFARPSADDAGRVSDVVLGAWTHLVADHVYNRCFNKLLERKGLKPGTVVREKKQADFDAYGRTLNISLVPEVTRELIAQCAAFPQYPVAEADVRGTCAVMERIVSHNTTDAAQDPTYNLLGSDYFAEVPSKVDALMRAGLHAYALGDANWGRER